jgi:hypothetical protein
MFIEQEWLVCKECFEVINRGLNVKEDIEKLVLQEKIFNKKFEGVDKLNPELIRERYNVI